MASTKLKPAPFFGNWSGHTISDLTVALEAIQAARPSQPIVYLAGDSSLDNKAWVPSYSNREDELPRTVPTIYNTFLKPAHPRPDIAYSMNCRLGEQATCLNTAIEASLLRQRKDTLLPQDEFIRDHIRSEDILIVSVGGNDIAMSPTFSTVIRLAQLAWLTPRTSIMNGSAWCLPYFRRLFRDQVQSYISRLTAKQKPRAVVVCMIYFPLEEEQNGWASRQLQLLGYNRYPGQLQAGITKMFEQATMQIKIEGTEVLPCALFESMDGKTSADYIERVEPSAEGGSKMANAFYDLLAPILNLETGMT